MKFQSVARLTAQRGCVSTYDGGRGENSEDRGPVQDAFGSVFGRDES